MSVVFAQQPAATLFSLPDSLSLSLTFSFPLSRSPVNPIDELMVAIINTYVEELSCIKLNIYFCFYKKASLIRGDVHLGPDSPILLSS
jgi:hypothetical protein